MVSALILGGCGFVGRHLVQKCLAAGWRVEVVDNLSSGTHPAQWALEQKEPHDFYCIDVRRMQEHFGFTRQYDYVFHCAAVVGGRLKIEGDPLAVAVDLSVDAEFYNWAVKAKPKKIIYFSSSAVYPIALQTRESHEKLVELYTHLGASHIGMPDFSYGWSKLSGEYLAQIAAKQYGLDVVTYRPFSGYGFDQSLDYPFPSIIQRAVRKEDPLIIWGSGDQERDFIHIDDIIDAVWATMDELNPGDVLNLGTGQPTSFWQLARLAANVIGYQPEIIRDRTKPEGVFSRVADTYKLDQFYKPTRKLDWGVNECAQWIIQTANAIGVPPVEAGGSGSGSSRK